MKTFFNDIYRLFKSVKLAIVVMLFIALTSALSTLIPQNKETVFYIKNYLPAISWIIIHTHFNEFFKSLYFLIPVVIFFINLSTCAITRFIKNLRKQKKKQFGPDILHIGILLLIIAAMFGIFGRDEKLYYLKKGDTINLNNQYSITLKSYHFLKYKDGRPKEWLSTVYIKRKGKFIKTYSIKVNKPLKLGTLMLYQNTYYSEQKVTLRDKKGDSYTIKPGDYYISGDSVVVFREVKLKNENSLRVDLPCLSSAYAIFEELETNKTGHKTKKIRQVGVSEKIGEYTIDKICITNYTGLLAVKDPSTMPVIVSLALIGFGISLTFIQKIGKETA